MSTKNRTLDRGWLGTASTILLILASTIGLYEMRIHPSLQGLDSKVDAVFSAGRYSERPEITIRSRYVGIAGIDHAFSFIVCMFLPGLVPFNEEQQIQMIYFLFTIASIIAIFSVEAFRSGSYRAWISYTSVLTALYQSTGGAVIFPIWFLLFLRHSAKTNQYEPSSLRVPMSYAKALIPSHFLGYLLPTVANFIPLHDPGFQTRQALNAFWQPSPIYVNILMVIFAQFFNATKQQTTLAQDDMKHIKTLHGCCFVTSLATHAALVYNWTQSNWSMADIFIPRTSLLQGSVPQVLYYIFQVDYAICFAVSLLATYIVVMDLNLMKKCDLSPILVGSCLVFGSLLIGPAATISAAWWWREGKLRVGDKNVGKGKRL